MQALDIIVEESPAIGIGRQEVTIWLLHTA
jgi:hypothetical protein